MKKAFFVATVFATVIVTACVSVAQYSPESDFAFTVIDNGKAVEITLYIGNATDVRIPERIQKLPVTMLGKDAFAKRRLTSVSIPDSVTHIDEWAFLVNKLTSVSIPSGADVHPEAFDPEVEVTRR